MHNFKSKGFGHSRGSPIRELRYVIYGCAHCFYYITYKSFIILKKGGATQRHDAQIKVQNQGFLGDETRDCALALQIFVMLRMDGAR